MVSVNKGNWDKGNDFDDVYQFNAEWIKESYRVLKPGGTLWVSGTYHNIYIIGSIISSLKFWRCWDFEIWRF